MSGIGCLVCDPGSSGCLESARAACRGDGSGYDLIEECPEGCADGVCVNLCEEAERTFSYTGCEYWPMPVSNEVNPRFSFAVVIASASAVPAEVEVSLGGEQITTLSLAPESLEVIELPWIDALKVASDEAQHFSAQVRNGAYRLTSTAPITVYQFNPLRYSIPEDCPEMSQDEPDGRCFSYSNDASLLLPVSAMAGQYLNLGYPSLHVIYEQNGQPIPRGVFRGPATVTILSIDGGPIEVDTPVPLAASLDGRVPPIEAGGQLNLELSPGEVLQLSVAEQRSCPADSPRSARSPFPCGIDQSQSCAEVLCLPDRAQDPTGIEIRSPARLQVISGHSCAFVPFNRFACDHLEESLPPLETWGRQALLPRTRSLRGEVNITRITSAIDGNQLTFTPSVHPPVTLNRGEILDFEYDEPFMIDATGPILSALFLVGQGADVQAERDASGDPAMAFLPPPEQYRREYRFLTPDTYEEHWLTIIQPVGATVTVNGAQVAAATPIGETGWAIAQVSLPAGSHRARSDRPFGITVQGFGSYTSYLFPGGLDLRPINDLMQ